MNVIIKSFAVPHNCRWCSFSECYFTRDAIRCYCRALEREVGTVDNIWEKRYDGCPLVELPTHGRLIDADALIIALMDEGIESIQMDDWKEIQQAVMDAPTIIEAENI